MNELEMVKVISEFVKRSMDHNPNFSELRKTIIPVTCTYC